MKLYKVRFTANKGSYVSDTEHSVYVLSEDPASARCDFYENKYDQIKAGWKFEVTKIEPVTKRTYSYISVLY